MQQPQLGRIGAPFAAVHLADLAELPDYKLYVFANCLAPSDEERRVITMLFCDVKGSTAAAEHLDPERWQELINGAFEHMIEPIYRYEGIVARLMGDGLLAFFGAPIAHEDDPERAVLAGLEIVERVDAYRREAAMDDSLAVRVGRALWNGDAAALESLASEQPPVDESGAQSAIAAGDEKRRRLGHYLGATFFYGGEWYWGIDRLHYLERRLVDLGIKQPSGKCGC